MVLTVMKSGDGTRFSELTRGAVKVDGQSVIWLLNWCEQGFIL